MSRTKIYDPVKQEWVYADDGVPHALQTMPQSLTEQEKLDARQNIEAEKAGVAATKIGEHNSSPVAHEDIRQQLAKYLKLIEDLPAE